MPNLERFLDYKESASLRMDYPPGSIAIAYRGTLDSSLLGRAFTLLGSRYPFLRARIGDRDGQRVLYVDPANPPLMRIVSGDSHDVVAESNRPLHYRDGLFELVVIAGIEEGYVLLRISRSIFGAAIVFHYFSELWRVYRDLVLGINVDSDVIDPPLPSSSIEVFESRGIKLSKSSAGEGGASNTASPPLFELVGRRLTISARETSALLKVGHKTGVSLHAIVSGVILTTIRAQSLSRRSESMSCLSPVDMSTRVSPPVGPTEVTTLASLHRAELKLGPCDDPIEVGREVRRQIDFAIRTLELLEPTRSRLALHDTDLEPHLSTVMISNNGAVPRFAQPPGFQIVDFFAPDDRQINIPYSAFNFMTYEGVLSIKAMFPGQYFSSSEIDQIADGISGALSSICGGCRTSGSPHN